MSAKPNAPMTPREYVEAIVLPTFRELVKVPADRRLAYLSAISAYHVVDYLRRAAAPADRKARDAEKRRIEGEIETRCGGDFHVVEGMCNGTKHCGRDEGRGKRFAPGDEHMTRAFGFAEGGGAAFGEAPFGPARLLVFHEGTLHIVDLAIRNFLLAAVDAFPQHLGAIDLTGVRI